MFTNKRIGIYAGTFDPVHEGHVSLMEQTIAELSLDMILCLPERLPPNKKDVTHFVHRKAMLKLAVDGIANIEVVRSKNEYALFPETIYELGMETADTYILMGADAAVHFNKWRNSEQIIKKAKIIVGIRTARDKSQVSATFQAMKLENDRYVFISTAHATCSSTQVRSHVQRPHPNIKEYIRKHRLYTL